MHGIITPEHAIYVIMRVQACSYQCAECVIWVYACVYYPGHVLFGYMVHLGCTLGYPCFRPLFTYLYLHTLFQRVFAWVRACGYTPDHGYEGVFRGYPS